MLSIGIVGLPNVGKSTLFNALLKRQAALAANYPFATIKPNIGMVDVPDERLQVLSQIVVNDYGRGSPGREIPEKVTPAVVKFFDIAGLVKGASQGEGLGNEFLGHIRDVNAIAHVIRDFNDENVTRAGSIDPKTDREIVDTELILADIQQIESRLSKLGKATNKDDKLELEIAQKILTNLNQNVPARNVILTQKEIELTEDLNLLTQKPIIYVRNVDENLLSNKNEHSTVEGLNEAIIICAKVESDLAEFDEKERESYLKELGIEYSGLNKLIKKGYEILGLETFLTAGPKEVRAWTIKSGSKAPQAAGVIHTDFERGFISAEVVGFKDLKELGSLKKAKEKGLVRLEGKEYVMKDGDVVLFRFSV